MGEGPPARITGNRDTRPGTTIHWWIQPCAFLVRAWLIRVGADAGTRGTASAGRRENWSYRRAIRPPGTKLSAGPDPSAARYRPELVRQFGHLAAG